MGLRSCNSDVRKLDLCGLWRKLPSAGEDWMKIGAEKIWRNGEVFGLGDDEKNCKGILSTSAHKEPTGGCRQVLITFTRHEFSASDEDSHWM